MRGWTNHALQRIKERYPKVLHSEFESVPDRIETHLRRDFIRLGDDRGYKAFVSIHLKIDNITMIKVKLIYNHRDRIIITALPFNNGYYRDIPESHRLKVPTGSNNFRPRNYWGA